MEPLCLATDWITRPAIDAELKRYVLLAYLQRVKARFDEARLYPHLEEVDRHATELRTLQEELDALRNALGREMIGFDPATGALVKAPLPHDVDALRVIEEVIAFSLPELADAARVGQERLEEVLAGVRFEPVGLLPLDLREGYLLLREKNEAHAYAYALTIHRCGAGHLQYRSVRTSYVGPYHVSIATPYETIKAQLTLAHRELPNPATFVFETTLPMPRIETCLPLARRMVWRAITAAA